nr:ATP-binding protein [Bacillus kexueae]
MSILFIRAFLLILITTNLEFAEWTNVFGDEKMTALLDRITHRSHILLLNGESYRFRQSMSKRKMEKDSTPHAGVCVSRPPRARNTNTHILPFIGVPIPRVAHFLSLTIHGDHFTHYPEACPCSK